MIIMVQREIYSVGLKRKVNAEVVDVIATPTKGGGFRYQVVGTFEEKDKTHKCQSMIGKADAEELASQLGIELATATPEPEVLVMEAEEEELVAEDEEPQVFESEEETPEENADSSLLVPDPSTSPMGDGRVYGQHAGLNVAGQIGEMSVAPHDYVWAGRAEGETTNDLIRRLRTAVSKHQEPEEIEIPLEAGMEQEITEEESDAEFEDILPSLKNVYSNETFVVSSTLKNYLAEQFWGDIIEGLFSIRSTEYEDEWEISFPPWMTEDVIEAIAEFQEFDLYGRAAYYDDEEDDEFTDDELEEMNRELAQWVKAEQFEARGFLDMDEMVEDDDANWDLKAKAAVGVAVLAIGVAYWWANRK